MVGTAWILDLLNISDHFAFWTRPLSSLENDVQIFFRYNVKYKAFSLRKKLLAITFERRVLWTWGQRFWVAFLMLFSGIPHLTIFFHICPYAHMPICPKYAHNGHNGHMGICEKIWTNGVSPKRESKMQLRDVNQRSLGHSNQKLWPKVDLGEFPPCNPHWKLQVWR